MPKRFMKPCKKVGCNNLTNSASGYCPEHEKEVHLKYDRERGSSAARGYDARWRRYRKYFLAQHPLCARCGGLAEVVDHIRPHKGDKVLFWDPNNHQALCKRCHDRKTYAEDGGFGRKILPRG